MSDTSENVQTSETSETSETGQTATVQPISTEGTIEARLLEMLIDLQKDADAIAEKVREVRAWNDSLFPVIGPLQTMMRNLVIPEKTDKLPEGAVKALEAVSVASLDRGIEDDVYKLLDMAQNLAFGLKSEDLSKVDTTTGMLIADQVRDALKLSVLLGLTQSTQELAKATLAHWEAALRDLRGQGLQTTRTVPSNTGTQGPAGGTSRGPGELVEQRGFKIRYECPKHPAFSTGTNPSGIYHYIREHYRDCNNLSVEDTRGGSLAFAAIKSAVDQVTNSDNPDIVVDLPISGRLSREYVK